MGSLSKDIADRWRRQASRVAYLFSPDSVVIKRPMLIIAGPDKPTCEDALGDLKYVFNVVCVFHGEHQEHQMLYMQEGPDGFALVPSFWRLKTRYALGHVSVIDADTLIEKYVLDPESTLAYTDGDWIVAEEWGL